MMNRKHLIKKRIISYILAAVGLVLLQLPVIAAELVTINFTSAQINGKDLSAYERTDPATGIKYFLLPENTGDAEIVLPFSVPTPVKDEKLSVQAQIVQLGGALIEKDMDWADKVGLIRNTKTLSIKIGGTVSLDSSNNEEGGGFNFKILNDGIREAPEETFAIRFRVVDERYELNTANMHENEAVWFRIEDDDELPSINVRIDNNDDQTDGPTSASVHESLGIINLEVNLKQSDGTKGGNAYAIEIPCHFEDPNDATNTSYKEQALSEFASPCPIRIPAEVEGIYKSRIYVKNDTLQETTEVFNLAFGDPVTIDPHLQINTEVLLPIEQNAALTLSITDDDSTGEISDTGIFLCADDSSQALDCTSEAVAEFPGQDANVESGNLADNFDNSTEGCIIDNSTGLMWEAKTDINIDSTYTWFNSNLATNGGSLGALGDDPNNETTPSCADITRCDTEFYIATVNDPGPGICGEQTGWRLPTLAELSTLLHYQSPLIAGREGLRINTNYFSTIKGGAIWTSTPSAYASEKAWVVDFKADTTDPRDNTIINPQIYLKDKARPASVILVRSLQ